MRGTAGTHVEMFNPPLNNNGGGGEWKNVTTWQNIRICVRLVETCEALVFYQIQCISCCLRKKGGS